MDKICGIYKIISPTNRVYIGQTNDLNKRLKSYQKADCKRQIRLYNSIKKYGWKAHKVEMIEYCAFKLLNEKERYWQDFYDVIGKMGLNCMLTDSSEKKRKMSEKARKNMSKAKKGKIRTKESLIKFKNTYKEKISNGWKHPKPLQKGHIVSEKN